MLALLSPAKMLAEGPAVEALPHTQPELLDEAEALIEVARDLDAADLKDLMGISDDLAELNVERFQTWSRPFTPGNARQAIRTFAGGTYQGFDAASLDEDDLAFAQDHVAILSGLYGLLRPLDLMQPYRLEMGTKLATSRGSNLYQWWGEQLAQRIRDAVADHDDKTIVNLASNEYVKAAKLKTLDLPVITPRFEDVKDGKARVLFVFAKQARGNMARWIAQHRVRSAEQLKAYDGMGYAYVPERSDDSTWVFQREQPPPVR